MADDPRDDAGADRRRGCGSAVGGRARVARGRPRVPSRAPTGESARAAVRGSRRACSARTSVRAAAVPGGGRQLHAGQEHDRHGVQFQRRRQDRVPRGHRRKAERLGAQPGPSETGGRVRRRRGRRVRPVQ